MIDRVSLDPIRPVVTLLLALAIAASPAAAEPDINTNFLPGEEALARQTRHNDFFVDDDPAHRGVILDLQTNPYALAERPAGLDYDVYSAIGYSLATSMMIVGPRTDADGDRRVVIVDTLEDATAARDLADEWIALYNRVYAPASGHQVDRLPLDAIVYTHNHIDHTGGVLGYLERADKEPCPPQDPSVTGLGGQYAARRSCVEVISQERVTDAVVNTSTISGQMIQARSLYMYGIGLRNHLQERTLREGEALPLGRAVTNGIGPFLSRGLAGFRMPSRTFADEMWLEAAGVRMRLLYVPSETNDELAIFVPDGLNGVADPQPAASGLLFSAEVIQGPAFPNLYSLRGTQYRSPATWYQSVDTLRQLEAWCMVPSHGPPVCGRDNVATLLRAFRDAVQFTNDQTVRLMNQGYKPAALAEAVQVPRSTLDDVAAVVPWPNATDDHGGLRGDVDPRDYLLPFYGSVRQAVREIYSGYLGWFDGDPVNLQPIPQEVAAQRLSALVGSGGTVLDAAQAALDSGDAQWAAELATLAIDAGGDDVVAARRLKSRAFVELGNRALNPNWSDWFFTAANELAMVDRVEGGHGTDPGDCFIPFQQVGLISPVIQAAVPLDQWMLSLTWKLDGPRAAAAAAEDTFGFWVIPARQDFVPDGYVLELRNGIVQVVDWSGSEADFLAAVDTAIKLDQATFDAAIASGDFFTALTGGIESGDVKVLAGTPEAVQGFFAWFDPPLACEPPVALPIVAEN